MIKNISAGSSSAASAAQVQETAKKTAAASEADPSISGDSVSLGQTDISLTSGVYSQTSGKLAAAADVDSLKQQLQNSMDQLKALVLQTLTGQGQAARTSEDSQSDAVSQAQSLISQDGPWGVEAVSTRLVDFAIAVSGGDASKLETLKAAIADGYSQAEKAFGGTLPDICQKTYDATMEKLDQWAAETDRA